MAIKIVAANWKMNGSAQSIDSFFSTFIPSLNGLKLDNSKVKVLICVPSIYISNLANKVKDTDIFFGAQNMHHELKGAFTGETSPLMLSDVGCSYVILGHSERRKIFGETDEFIAKKVKAAVNNSLFPIFCVGETKEEHESNNTISVITKQLKAVLDILNDSELANLVIAYEPIWAIGTGLTATPQQAQEVHAHIRSEISKKNAAIASKMSIIYGGSVKSSNAEDLFEMADIDGGLIGGASLDPIEFSKICNAAS